MALKNGSLMEMLWRIYNRPDKPLPWVEGGNLPWDEPAFSERMLAEHLDQSHNAASRKDSERAKVIPWLWQALDLVPGKHVLDFTCGPGLYAVDLALRGCQVLGIDFSPASIAYARLLAEESGTQDRCNFVEQDVRLVELAPETFDAALFLYGQLAVFTRGEASDLLQKLWRSLKPGAKLVIELLNQDRVDKKNSSWWFTDDKGLWGERPFLHLGERIWLEGENISVDRFYVLDLQSESFSEITLFDQTYAIDEVEDMLVTAGFSHVQTYIDWADLDLYDRGEWVVYVAQK